VLPTVKYFEKVYACAADAPTSTAARAKMDAITNFFIFYNFE
jgi:hypothetical protein